MKPIIKIKGRGLPLTIDDIDTDRIIPSRFLRCVTFDGIGDYLFMDERFDSEGMPTDFPMNQPLYEGASIILSGKNFGCGSSREHAPQAIKRAGFKAVIAESFAEIFFGNATTIGLACIVLKKEDIARICRHVAEKPKDKITIHIDAKKVEFNNLHYDCYLPEVVRQAFINGTYDLLSELLKNKNITESVAEKLPY